MNILVFIQQLDVNSLHLIDLAKKAGPDRLLHKPAQGWSVLEVLEHVCLTERGIFAMLGRPGTQQHSEEELYGAQRIKQVMVHERGKKMEAPEGLKPKGKISDLESFESLLRAQREKLKEDLLAGRIAVDTRVFKHSYLGEMTISDWLYFVIHHAERHALQIEALLKAG